MHEIGDIPCPHCREVFHTLDDLYTHALKNHSQAQLITVLEGHMAKITKDDFTQVDGHWVYAVDGFTLSLEQAPDGAFRLSIVGTLDGIPAATAYPTEPEWDQAIKLANKFADALALVNRRN